MAMQPRTPWSMVQYREAKDLLSIGQSDPEQLSTIVGMVEDFERDINDGYTPPAGKQEGVPLRRTAQEVGVSREYDPTGMAGQLAPATSPQESPLALDTDDLEGIQRWRKRPTTTDVNLRSASGEKALYSPPVYTPDPGEIDPSTGLATPGEGSGDPMEPYFHQEPSVAQAIDYIKRAQKTTGDEAMIAQWDVTIADMEEHGEESEHWKQFADRQYQEVYRVMASHRVPVTRVAYQDVTEGNIADRLEGEFARISEPFIAGADQMATFGVGAEAMAMHGNKRYSQHHEQALAELEESGTLMPMAARTKDIMESSPWITGAGMLAGAFTPGGAVNLLAKFGTKAVAAGGKLLASKTPTLLRGTGMGMQAARGVGKHGLTGGGTALAEESARAGVGAGGRRLRDEEEHDIGTPMGPGEAFLAGAGGGILGGGIAAGVGKMAKNLRLTSDRVTREAIGKTEDLLGEGKRGTSWIAGTKETPEMKAVLETELRSGTSAGRKTGVEESLRGMRGDVAELGRKEQEVAFRAAGEEKVAFHAANEATLKSMQESSDRMLLVARNREGTPFADDATFFDAFKKVTDVKPVATKGEAQALVKAHGGQVMSLGDAKKLFGAKFVKAKLGKFKTEAPDVVDVVDDAPIELLPRGQGFRSGPLQEPAEAALDSSPIHFVVQGKKLNPRQYDDAVDALNRKIRYGEGDAYKDPEWRQLGLAFRKDRDQFGGEWGATKKRHEDVANLWEKRRKDLGIKGDWNERDQLQLDNIHVALRRAGNVDDATDAEIWALLEKKPALLKKLRVTKAAEARRELKSGSQKVTKWGVLSDLAAGTRLRVDPMLSGMIGDPLTRLGPARLGMLTPPTETVQGMASGSKDLLQRLYGLITGSPEGQDDVSPPSN